MKILSCHIDAFGKLNNVDIDFAGNLNSICEENGYGKTTLVMFLKAMFYGLGSNSRKNQKLSDRTKYQPLSQGLFGGSITFETEKGKFKAVRSFKKTVTQDEFFLYNAETNMPSKAYRENLGEEIFRVGKETFDATVFFAQNELPSEINDNIRASLVGNISADDVSALSLAIKKIKEKKAEFRSQIKNIDIVKEKRNLQNLLDRKNFLTEKISLSNDSIKSSEKNLEEINLETKKMKGLQTKLEDFKGEKKATELLVEEKEKELKNFQEEINIQKNKFENLKNNKKNAKKSKKIDYFLIFSIISIIFSIISVGIYFPIKNIILIILFVVFFVLGVILGVLHFRQNKKTESEDLFFDEEKYHNLQKEELIKIGNLKELEQKLFIIKSNFQKEFPYSEEEFIKKMEYLDFQQRKFENERVTSLTNLKHYTEEFENLEEVLEENEDSLNDHIELFKSVNKNLDLLEKTEEFLMLSSDNLSKRYIEPVQKKFDEYFKRFFVDDKIIFNANLTSLLSSLKEDSYLSAGTLDLVNICKRFALVELLYNKEKPFLVLDDPFVNLDDKNLDVAKKIVYEMAKEYQIIFLTCHSTRKI